jgi:hypothetical protein
VFAADALRRSISSRQPPHVTSERLTVHMSTSGGAEHRAADLAERRACTACPSRARHRGQLT